ncbi:glycerol-3-phosphate 1-O-acyltransferase PlsY [bacterium]|uniref:Glycerol-3-phosphate acyltransferase n=1 Tax=Candidatus Nealsonbacteria bacterium CG15_BIG_FIL_POST_REV_8_21_14_020_37_12 TaxID=1974716 RepID=A0A2M7H1N1_9BACT|nr:glycerol-3-phosphate 1-O-acyltransferase PlsY [bacterium]PIW35169.1 MAG: acyl-phosphate glycerol 3-phosphate acyltransferase [Candidatus Nealsonbacteria bacterium CG15_BIG_FIL_POST_REV_8_21_14_020_37_12]
MPNLILLIIFGYLLGSVPFSYLIPKAKGIDIRKVGSGNVGATNVIRALGLKFGLLATILDLLKAVIPVYLATRFLLFDWQIALVAITPVFGHIFPIWLNFRGGKGVGSTIGVLFILLGWERFLILLSIWLIVIAIFQIMSVASLLMSSLLPLFMAYFSYPLPYFFLVIALAVLIWWAHRENLQRIKEGIEPKLKFKKSL